MRTLIYDMTDKPQEIIDGVHEILSTLPANARAWEKFNVETGAVESLVLEIDED